VVATVEESVLKMEMTGLESQEEDAPKRILFFKPMSWLGQIRSHRRDESWSASLWQTFFSTSMGAQIPAIAEKPLATYGCRKFQLDPLGDHLNKCTSHSGAKKVHDWMVDQVADLFRTTHKSKTIINKQTILRFIRKTATLTRIFPTLDLRMEEKTVWRSWKNPRSDCTVTELLKLPDVLAITDMKPTPLFIYIKYI
jgi:hypothetical protein